LRTLKQEARKGQVLIMVTLALVPMFGLMGLVTDLGYMHFIKMSAQTAAQAAAQAAIIDFHATVGGSNFVCGSGGVTCSATPTTCTASLTTATNSLERGCMYAQAHGFNSSNQAVTYQAGTGATPPTAAGIGTASYWVTFRVAQRVPQLFSAVLGNTSGLVVARSTAVVMGGSDCIFALNRTQSGAVSVGGSANLVSSCGVFVNSNSSTALSTNGGVLVQATEFDIVGNTQAILTPPPNTGVSPITDPLASLPVPASAPYTCDYVNYNPPNWSNPTLYPGVYCGGINVGNNTYTLTTGNYILVGGGLTTQSANSHISGDGVMIYNTFGSGTGHTYSYSPINIAANSTVSLKAYNTGTYAGILFFEDRSAPASSDTYGGGSSAVYQGVIYAKNAAVTMYGNSGVSAYTILVADTITLVGTTNFNNDYSLLATGSPIQTTALVE